MGNPARNPRAAVSRMPRSTEGIQLWGNGAAEDVIDKLDALVTFGRFKFDAANAKLAVTAGLFLVFAFDIGATANGFAIWNLRRLERQIDVITLVQFGDDDFDVLLP
jgi:hypothetical protein